LANLLVAFSGYTNPPAATHCNTLQPSPQTRTIQVRETKSKRSAKYCNTPQHTVAHCNTLQHTATVTKDRGQQNRSALHYTATHCDTLQHTATHSNALQHTATHYDTLQHTSTHCNTLQHTATHCNTLQHTATHTLQVCGKQNQKLSYHVWRESRRPDKTVRVGCQHD